MAQCISCGYVTLEDAPACWHCEEAHQRLLERLTDGDDGALTWPGLAAWVQSDVAPREQVARVWRIG
jgi:hypothetical protein